jgi:regulator of replication initiation timing
MRTSEQVRNSIADLSQQLSNRITEKAAMQSVISRMVDEIISLNVRIKQESGVLAELEAENQTEP